MREEPALCTTEPAYIQYFLNGKVYLIVEKLHRINLKLGLFSTNELKESTNDNKARHWRIVKLTIWYMEVTSTPRLANKVPITLKWTS